MRNKLKFNKIYFLLTIILFAIEILIGTYINDSIIRPHIGDFLVVILIYCFIKSFFIIQVDIACISVLIFSYFVEILQYFNVVEIMHLNQYKIARIIIGTSFTWIDLIAYTAGIVLVFVLEKFFHVKTSTNTI